jgi:hypothetical protein
VDTVDNCELAPSTWQIPVMNRPSVENVENFGIAYDLAVQRIMHHNRRVDPRGDRRYKGALMGSVNPVAAECACLGCDYGRHSVDEIRAGRCSRFTADIDAAVESQGWVAVHTGPPDDRSLYLCDLCARSVAV